MKAHTIALKAKRQKSQFFAWNGPEWWVWFSGHRRCPTKESLTRYINNHESIVVFHGCRPLNVDAYYGEGFPKEGDEHLDCEWIEVTAQAVPPHVGSPTPGNGYESGDSFAAFLPPAVTTDEDGLAPHNRAVVFVTEYTIKGTDRAGQEYASPLLVLTGEEYSRITFEELHRRICDALRGNRSPVVAEVFLPSGTHKIVRVRKEK